MERTYRDVRGGGEEGRFRAAGKTRSSEGEPLHWAQAQERHRQEQHGIRQGQLQQELANR